MRARQWRCDSRTPEKIQEYCGGRIVFESDSAEFWRDGIHEVCGLPDYSCEPEREGRAGGEELCAAGGCAGENRNCECVPAGGGCAAGGGERDSRWG